MGGLKLPNPTELEVIKRFLSESSHMWVEAVRFRKPAAGLSMSVTYRNLQDETKVQTLHMPDCKDFEELTLLMSDVLDNISGVAMALMARAKARRQANADA
jgi:hypothetical protein